MTPPPKLLILVGSPRRKGNSATMAEAVKQGAGAAGASVTLRHLEDHLSSFLRDCRTCRGENGECGIEDNFRSLFFDDFLPSDEVVFYTPVYWYGISAQTKAFFDRTFCYYAASYPQSTEVIERMSRKRIGLVLASEETYPGASLGIIHRIQEYARYTHSDFGDVVRGIGNRRGQVDRDPGDPLSAAKRIGKGMFVRVTSDYRIDTERSSGVCV